MRLPLWGRIDWDYWVRALLSSGSVLGLCVSMSGCLGNQRQQQELLEAELRCQERHIQEMKEELDRKEGVLHAMDVEVERAQQAAVRGKPDPGDSAPVANVVKEIALGRLTGGVRQNPKAQFDDALQVILEPRDADGHAIKAPGSVHLDLFEITPQGLKTALSSWDITHRELRRLWDEPLLGGPAYRITLPWKALPSLEKLRVIARFTTLDGKLFEAERDFTIRLPAGVVRPGLPIGMPGGYCPPPDRGSSAPRIDERLAAPKAAPSPLPAETTPPPAASGDVPAANGIPMIQLPPRELSEKNETSKGDGVPPLPAPPEPPSFDKGAQATELLPPPRTSPETDNPVPPGTTAVPKRKSQTATPLTAPPPQLWRDRQSNLVQVSYSDAPPIKLSKPVRAREME